MSKVNTTIKIKCADEEIARTFFNYLQMSQPDVKRNVDNHLRQVGRGLTDTTFENVKEDKLTFEVTANPTDKGDVLIQNEDGLISTASYTELEEGELYIYMDGGKVTMFQYKADDIDRPLQGVPNLGVAYEMFKMFPDLLEQEAAAIKRQAEQEALAAAEAALEDEDASDADVSEGVLSIVEDEVEAEETESTEVAETAEGVEG